MRAAGVDPIDGYLRTLGRSLRGPARLKSDLIAEARDGLADAAEAYREAGLPTAEAEGRAVREFGRLPEVAPAYQAELAAAAVQRLALWLAVVPAALGAGSDLMWRGAPWTAVAPPPGYGLLSTTVDRLGALLTAGAFVAFVWLAWSAHRGRPVSAAAARWLALGGLGAVAALTLGGLGLYGWTVGTAPAVLTWPPMIVGGFVTAAALGWLGVRSARCLAWVT